MTSPTVTMERYAEDLHDLYTKLFSGVLLNASTSEASWKHRLETFKSVSLQEFVVPSNIKPEPLTFDESRVDDPKYRRWFVRKLQAPRPSKWARHILPIHRDQVDDEKYRTDIAKVIAYNWIKRLDPVESDVQLIPLMKATVSDLEMMLDKARMSIVSADWGAGVLLHVLADKLVGENPKFQEIEAEIKAVGKAAREELAASLKELGERVMAEASESLGKIVADTNRDLDDTMNGIRERLAESGERARIALAEHGIDPNEDREETFRRAVKSREAKMRKERRDAWRKRPIIVRVMPWLATIATGAALFFNLEVAGVTPHEWLNSVDWSQLVPSN